MRISNTMKSDLTYLASIVTVHAHHLAKRYSLPRAQIEPEDLLNRTAVAMQAAIKADPARYESLTADDRDRVAQSFTLNTARNLARELARGNRRNGQLTDDGEVESKAETTTHQLDVEEEVIACRLWLERNGTARDLRLFDLLREGTSRDEIAQQLEMAARHVSVLVHRLKRQLLNYRNWW